MSQNLESAPQEPAESSQAEVIFHWLRLLRLHKGLIVLGAVIGVVVGSLYYAQSPPIYDSNCQVLVIKKQPTALATALGSDSYSTLASRYEDYLATHMVLIKSPAIISRAVKKLEGKALRMFEGKDPAVMIPSILSLGRDGGGRQNDILTFSCRGEDVPISVDN